MSAITIPQAVDLLPKLDGITGFGDATLNSVTTQSSYAASSLLTSTPTRCPVDSNRRRREWTSDGQSPLGPRRLHRHRRILLLGYFLGVVPLLGGREPGAAAAAAGRRPESGGGGARRARGGVQEPPALKAKLARLQLQMPGTPDGSTFADELSAAADEAQVAISSITLAEPAAFGTPAGAAAPVDSRPGRHADTRRNGCPRPGRARDPGPADRGIAVQPSPSASS
ncbi:MAG: hypothetical protein WDM88_11060 [Galbitalea sp.]